MIRINAEFDLTQESAPHFEERLKYLKDCAKFKEPWKLWETSNTKVIVDGISEDNWVPLFGEPSWSTISKYRRKPQKTIQKETTVTFNCPLPHLVPPKEGTVCFCLSSFPFTWVTTEENLEALNWGIVFKTKEDMHLVIKNIKEAIQDWKNKYGSPIVSK